MSLLIIPSQKKLFERASKMFTDILKILLHFHEIDMKPTRTKNKEDEQGKEVERKNVEDKQRFSLFPIYNLRATTSVRESATLRSEKARITTANIHTPDRVIGRLIFCSCIFSFSLDFALAKIHTGINSRNLNEIIKKVI